MKNAIFNSILRKKSKQPLPSSDANSKGGALEVAEILKGISGLPVHLVDGVKDMVLNVTDYLKVAQQEESKRTEIAAKRDVALKSIESQRETISEILKLTFQERAAVLQKQFDVLDQAMASGNAAIVDSSLKSMVAVIQASPFKSISEMQQSLGSKDFVIRLE